MLTELEVALALLTLGFAGWFRPWRMLAGPLLSPFLAGVVLLPWFWMLPQMLPSSVLAGGVSVQLSGASLLTLMLGFPLAVLALTAVAGVVWLAGSWPVDVWLSQWVWLGLVPAWLVIGLGAVLRRWLPPQVFIYILGRGFLGTAVVVFLSGVLYEVVHHLVGGVTMGEAFVARWLMAWGDAFLTGMLVAIFVAFRPEWLATWSDRRYLVEPPAQGDDAPQPEPMAPSAVTLPPDRPRPPP
jgi:uncharacterized membrane protein